jgi:hypothetical protein
MPSKIDPDFVINVAKSFAKEQPYATRIGLILVKNKVHEMLSRVHSHNNKWQYGIKQ